MTNRGTRARWTTAALVAPTAAALFTGTTVWAAGHQPASSIKATPKVAATVDPTVVALRQAVDSNAAQVANLRKSVASLQKQADAIVKGTATKSKKKHSSSSASSSSSGSSSYSSSNGSSTKKKKKSSSSSNSSSGGSSYVAPPPAQGSTGASGA